ncbi:MAG TPA: NAD-dependent epimerase/dehydratase family protein, partial [candidate division Zixibacteria bacterium]|nr:NAD-dependent epimerase/dehydratase family protein [candidate division Zixibacteria bacterium]
MKVAVTGGTGCFGWPLLKKLIAKDFDVRLLVHSETPLMSEVKGRVYIVNGDLSSNEALFDLTWDCDVVFHLAGKIHLIPRTEEEKQEFYRVNVEGTRNLLKAAKENGVRKIIFYSTVGVYGKDADFHGDEVSSCQPITAYAKSKYLAEQLVLNAFNNGGPEGIVLRFPVAYGPLDRGNVAKLIEAVRRKMFFYFGNGKCLRSMVSSGNAAEAALGVASATNIGNEIFCITDDRDYMLREIIEAIYNALETNWRPFHVPILIAELVGKLGDLFEKTTRISFPVNTPKVMKLSRSLTFSCEKAKRMFGYKPTETLEDGIFKEVE